MYLACILHVWELSYRQHLVGAVNGIWVLRAASALNNRAISPGSKKSKY